MDTILDALATSNRAARAHARALHNLTLAVLALGILVLVVIIKQATG